MPDHETSSPDEHLADEQAVEREHADLVVKAIRRADQSYVRGEDPRIAQWLSRRVSAVRHLHRASVIARSHLTEGQDWQELHEILSGLETNFWLDVLNVAEERDVWHLPRGWREVDFSQADAEEFDHMRIQVSESEGRA